MISSNEWSGPRKMSVWRLHSFFMFLLVKSCAVNSSIHIDLGIHVAYFFLMTRLLRKLCYTLCPYLRLPVMSCMRYVYWISSTKIPFESLSCRSALNELLNVADKTVCSVKWYMSWGNVDNGAGRNAIHLYLEVEIRGISITATIESITTKFLLIVI